MNINTVCADRRKELIELWVNQFFSSYPLDNSGFLRTKRDRFANPVGETTRISAEILYDAVIGGDVEADAVKQALQDLILVRAVQNMPPAKAVGALYLLKNILRQHILPECLKPENFGQNLLNEYLDTESRIDTLGLLALDMYTEARERVFRIRVEEVKRSQSQLIRLAKLRREQSDSVSETANRGVEE